MNKYEGFVLVMLSSTCTACPQKKDLLLWRAVAPINFDLGSKVGGVLESGSSVRGLDPFF